MLYYDGFGNRIEISSTGGGSSELDEQFKVTPVRLDGKGIIPCPGDGEYSASPWVNGGSLATNDRAFINFNFYNSAKTRIYPKNAQGVYGTNTQTLANYIWKIEGRKLYNAPIYDFNVYVQKAFSFNFIGEFDEDVAYISCSTHKESASTENYGIAYNHVSLEPVEDNYKNVTIETEKTGALLPQINSYTQQAHIDSLADLDAFGRRLKSESIYAMNKARHAFRIATYNVKGSGGYNQHNWYRLKECFEEYGIDLVGLQEVSFPLKNSTGRGTFAEYFTDGWQFPYASDNGDAYRKGDGDAYEGKNERMLLSRYPIDSTEEVFYTSAQNTNDGDYRYYAKSVVSLPRYMDKRGSEKLKMSIYNTQLEVLGTTTAQSQARELLAAAQADENPFIIIMGDTNDFSITKEVWKIFKEGGFEPVITTNSSTVSGTWDFNCIDNFFLSKRIKSIDYDIIWSQLYQWYGIGSVADFGLSDHDMVIADIELDYSDIRCINLNLKDGITADISNGKTWLTDKDTVTVTLSGNVTAIEAYDCMIRSTKGATAFTISGNTITIDGSKLIGDVYIKAT